MIFPRRTLFLFLALVVTLGASPVQLDELPQVVSYRVPRVPAAALDAQAEVHVTVEINEQGQVTQAFVTRASDPSLAMPCLKAVRTWRYVPAIRDGAPVRARFVQPIRFGADEVASISLVTAPAVVIRRVAPEVPSELQEVEADIEVALSIDGHGRVQDATIVSSTEPDLNDATIDAALRWTFKPARDEGFPVASKVHVPFHFQGKADGRNSAERTARANTTANRRQH